MNSTPGVNAIAKWLYVHFLILALVQFVQMGKYQSQKLQIDRGRCEFFE